MQTTASRLSPYQRRQRRLALQADQLRLQREAGPGTNAGAGWGDPLGDLERHAAADRDGFLQTTTGAYHRPPKPGAE